METKRMFDNSQSPMSEVVGRKPKSVALVPQDQSDDMSEVDTVENILDAHVGARLRMARRMAGVSQGQLAAKIGLTFQQIQKHEWGSNRIGAGRLYQIAQELNIDINWFYEGLLSEGMSDGEPSVLNDERMLMRKETLGLIRAYYAVADVRVRRAFISFLRSMAKITPKD